MLDYCIVIDDGLSISLVLQFDFDLDSERFDLTPLMKESSLRRLEH